LEERQDAEQGRNKDGQGLHHIRNLATLCQSCHDKHHAEQIHIGPIEDTSEGPVRSVLDLSQYAYTPSTTLTKTAKKSTFTKEQVELIKETQQAYPQIHRKLLVLQIEKLHGFKVTEAQFKSLQTKGFLQ
jgi:hypothetical protein